MAKRVWGSTRGGNDSDEGNSGLRTEKVQIDNSYFEKLRGRLNHGIPPQEFHHPVVASPTGGFDEGDTLAALNQIEAAEAAARQPAAPAKPASPGFVIYGDDGRPIK